MPAASGGYPEEGRQDLNFSRNAALWLVIVLLLLGLFYLFQGPTTRGPQPETLPNPRELPRVRTPTF